MALLEATTNQFRGVVIKPESLPDDPGEFNVGLRQSLDAWRAEGLLVIWFQVPISKSALIPIAVEAGFTFHHSNPDYLMMTLQIVQDAHVPPFATHYIGAGGVVLRDEKDLLVVCERHRRPGQAPFYKLPGGALLAGEHLADAVVREVLEETGVHTQFDALVCFRHWHGYRYGKSDIYFVCRLHPLSQEITMQESEIEDCLWMPVADFLGSAEVSVFNKSIVSAALGSPGVAPSQIAGFEGRAVEFFMPNL
ncbi:MAG: NUDIX domain-containing protein [Chloroflexi bacterium]|nr:NUDIX domain-containing protein [Chloroflexota bacterium]